MMQIVSKTASGYDGFHTTPSSAYVLTGTAIYTMDDTRPRVEAVGVIGERIVATGSVADVKAALPRGAQRIDLGGRMLLPGFTDSHNHFAYLARKWRAVDLDGCVSPDEALHRVKDFAAGHPDANWIEGHGWDGNRWSALPTRFDLDGIVPERPVALSSKDGHALWANTAALTAAGLVSASGERSAASVPFDEHLIVKDAESGIPTGIVYETAVKYVLSALPQPPVSTIADAIAAGLPKLHAQGITAVHCPEQPDDWRAYGALRAAGRLGVRVTYWLPVAFLEEAIRLGITTGFGDEWLRFGPVKIFADGTLGQRTAAMLAPFEGEPDNVGVALYEAEQLAGLVRRAAGNGLAVAIHAIGDRAVRDALDAFAGARRDEETADGDVTGLRHRIEHAQLIHRDDVGRFAQLGVIASMQPLHCPADKVNAERFWGERTAGAFPFRSLLDAGASLAFGSDAPFGLDLTVNSFSVLAGIDAAVNRRSVGSDDASWHPEQCIAVGEALKAFTIGAAYAGGEEQWRGSLTPGKVADMVVLSDDLHAVAPRAIADVDVQATFVGGRLVYGDIA